MMHLSARRATRRPSNYYSGSACTLWIVICNYNMKSILANSDPIVTFIHQMIPHHQNAVNMAKALLKTNTLDSTDEDDREMENMMWAIINGQNFFQIHGRCGRAGSVRAVRNRQNATPSSRRRVRGAR